ncbi:conserved hypothetical protein [Frankia sp. AiPs1]|uniref:DUF6907 domain-containing protein n=1 Tax=Frankia sp. AiPa1 TaxID=573492 RepID=UPI00202B6AB0|nr:hypothetical protein [Frankia sp. AiPa1]MCL9762981.1 hypothetical protein [Frankia sp. AiPa1]
MNAPVGSACPRWCDQPAGHLGVEAAGPADYHVSAFTLVDLPEIPGIREGTAIQVAIEQYVTSTTSYDPLISLGIGDDTPDSEPLTLDEAAALAAALTRAVTAARDTPTRRNPDDTSPA